MGNNRGLTLLEVLIVVVLIGIMAAVAAPSWMAWSKSARFKDASQVSSSAMRQARGHAININQRVRVDFNIDAQSVTVNVVGADEQIFLSQFGEGIILRGGANCTTTSGTVSITFNPNGSSGTGYVCVGDSSAMKYRIGVGVANTGRIVTTRL